MVDITNYLNVYDVLINEVIGDIWLAVIVGIVLIVFASVNFKMPFQLTIMSCLLWLSIIFAANTGLTVIWVFVVMIAGLMFYYGITKLFR